MARYGLGVLVSLGNMLVLTWWIGPHAYGIFVTGIGLVAFLSNLARAGIDTYLVRHEQNPSNALYSAASTAILAISIILTLAGAGAAPLLAHWLGNWEFAAPYCVLLLSVPVIGLTGVPMAKLERELSFRAVAGIELGGQFLGLAISASMAWMQWGVWAPVGGQISWQIFTLIGACRAARLFPRIKPFDWEQVRPMLAYGLGVTASLRSWQLRTLVNPLIVGRFAGVEAVAFVALAMRIAEALGTFRLAAGRMAIASLARVRGCEEQFRALLQQAMYLQVSTLGPLLCGFALAGPFILRHVAGTRWTPSLAVYPFIAAGVLINSVYSLQASALFVTGKQWVVMRAHLLHVALLGAGTFVLLPRCGTIGYGWAELLACSAYWVIHASVVKNVSISYRRLMPLLGVCLALVFVPALRNALVGFYPSLQNSGVVANPR